MRQQKKFKLVPQAAEGAKTFAHLRSRNKNNFDAEIGLRTLLNGNLVFQKCRHFFLEIKLKILFSCVLAFLHSGKMQFFHVLEVFLASFAVDRFHSIPENKSFRRIFFEKWQLLLLQRIGIFHNFKVG